MFEVLIVCSGNTCRSPMAAALLNSVVSEGTTGGNGDADDPPVRAVSAGITAVDDYPATSEAVAICSRGGIDLTGHGSRRLVPEMVDEAHLVLVMEDHHRQAVLRLQPAAAEKVFLLTELAGQTDPPGVSDPIGGGVPAYEAAFDEIARLLRSALPRIIKLAEEQA